jgi:hypothetical protein
MHFDAIMMTEKVLDILEEHTVLVTTVEVFCDEISLQAEVFYPKDGCSYVPSKH